jgi:hypothetical protein
MKKGPGNDIGRRPAMRSEAWNTAAEEHLFPKPGSVINLAIRLKAWRHLEAIDPAWRQKDTTVPPETANLEEHRKFHTLHQLRDSEDFNFKRLQTEVMAFEQQYQKAFREGGEEGRRFARQLSKAFAMSEDRLSSRNDTGRQYTVSVAGIMTERYISLHRFRFHRYGKSGPTSDEGRNSFVESTSAVRLSEGLQTLCRSSNIGPIRRGRIG